MAALTKIDAAQAALVAQELLARRRARKSLSAFAEYMYPGYEIDPFHAYVANILDSVVERKPGERRRIMIFAPPQHGKSLLTSELFPAYYIGRRPNDPMILASYVADLAESKSREVRNYIESDSYKALFGNLGPRDVEPITTDQSTRAVNDWKLAPPHRGKMRAVGVGGSVTGFPAKMVILDDLIKDWQEAQSPTVRNTVWNWWKSVLRTRIWEDGAIVFITTRWHEDDIAARLMALGGWEIYRFPALAETQEERDENNRRMAMPKGLPDLLGREPGEALAPHRFSRNALLDIYADVGSLVKAALYDGVPRPAEGARIKRSYLSNFVDEVPARAARFVRYWDKAASTNENGPATAGVLLTRHEGLTYIVDVMRGHFTPLERKKIERATAELDEARYGSNVFIYAEQEPGSGGKESAQETIRNLSGFNIRADLPATNKDARMEPFIAQAEAGNVRLVRGDWNQVYIDEMVAIPNGATRDMGDATSGAFNKHKQLEDELPSVRRARVKFGKAEPPWRN